MADAAAAPEGIEIRHSFADVNGVRLHYATAGAGKLVLFLHGFPEFWYEWKNQLAEFGRHFQAAAPDMRGYNLSSKPAELADYTMDKLVGDVRDLVHHLGARSCLLVGHDWGGVVAWATAIALPELVEKLVTINAPHPGVFRQLLKTDPEQQQASQYMLVFRSPGMYAEDMLSANGFGVMREMVFGDVLRSGYFTEADWQKYVEAWSQPGALTGGLNYYRAAQVGPPSGEGEPAFAGMDRLPSLEVKVPTLVIWGEKDIALTIKNLDGLDKYVSNLRVERVPGATHWVVHEQPALVNRLLREFFAGSAA
jgi:epoxide hydrolase 4